MTLIESMEYPGRIIVLGMNNKDENVVLFAQTGRSASSQAKKLRIHKNSVSIEPLDKKILEQGDSDLLMYKVAEWDDRGVAVSNGKQTGDIFRALDISQAAEHILVHGLAHWTYEPDGPIFTPRINGCLLFHQEETLSCLSILKRGANDACIRNYFTIPQVRGKAFLISTYNGENSNPAPSFEGEPIEINININDANHGIEALYRALGPSSGPDFRVAVLCAIFNQGELIDIAIKNRHNEA